MIHLLFFARLGEDLDTTQLDISSQSISVVEDIIQHLKQQGEPWISVFEQQTILVSVNQDIAQKTAPVKDHDEVAFFPPVTGG